MDKCDLPKIDFTSNQFCHRLNQLRGTNELIAKAIGFRKDVSLTVWDTTAGLGVESFLLAALGCHVTLFERHPKVAQALKEAIEHAKKDPKTAPIVKRMTLHQTCALAYLTQHPDLKPDVIYCDPMFCPRKKSAASKQGITLLQNLVGEDNDAERLVALAIQRAPKRVVVKRAKGAPELAPNPTFSLTARSHRFDVYAFNRI